MTTRHDRSIDAELRTQIASERRQLRRLDNRLSNAQLQLTLAQNRYDAIEAERNRVRERVEQLAAALEHQ